MLVTILENLILNFLLAFLILIHYQKIRYMQVNYLKAFGVTLLSCIGYTPLFGILQMLFPSLNSFLNSNSAIYYFFANISNIIVFEIMIYFLIDRNLKLSIFLFSLLWSLYQLIIYTFNNIIYLFSNHQHILYYLFSYMNLFLTYMVINYLIKRSHIHTYINMLEEHLISYPKILGLSVGFLSIFPVMQIIIQREEPGFMAIEQFILTFVVICILVLFYFVIQSVQAKEQQKYLSMMLQQQNLYIQSLESIQQNMREFKHDYHNMMVSLYLQSKEGNVQKIEQQLAQMMNDFDDSIGEKMNLVTQLSNIKISEMKSLLMEKLTIMQKKKIPVKLEILYEIKSINMNVIDFTRILGILLDNSIEEVESYHGDIVIIMLQQDSRLSLRVENTIHEQIDIHEISKPGYSTKGSTRGMGLSSLEKIIMRYPNIIHNVMCENDRFIQEITILERSRTNDKNLSL